MRNLQMENLIEQLNAATYEYEMGSPIMSDREWDDMYFELQRLETEAGFAYSNSPTQKIIFSSVSKLHEVTHNHLMLSLAKTKDKEEVKSFIGDNEFLQMAKMDGLTCSLRYSGGRLISAETRGDGEHGEDITVNAQVINTIPKRINYENELIVDGEIICKWDDFEQYHGDYMHPRNFAAGSIRLLDSFKCASRHLTFVAWDVIKGFTKFNLLNEKLDCLDKLGFTIVPYYLNTFDSIQIEQDCKDKKYPIDGLVYKFNDIEYGKSLGSTVHHFKNALAYKFYDEASPTFLQNIEWGAGMTGLLTPVAVFDPVESCGAIIQRATLHNVRIIKKLLKVPFVGQKISIIKSNEVIPEVVEALSFYDGTQHILEIPKECPICGKPTKLEEGGRLFCTNPSCFGQVTNQILHFCGEKGLDIEGLSKKTVHHLVEWGWVKNRSDVLQLRKRKEEWIHQPGYGEKRINNILTGITKACTNTPLWRIIASAGIPTVGLAASKEIEKHCETWENFLSKVESGYDFTALKYVGQKMQDNILNYDYSDICEVVKLCNGIQNYNPPDVGGHKKVLANKLICITGKLENFNKRADLIDIIEAQGGHVAQHMTKKVDYLINNDNLSTSSKNRKAQELRVPVITERQFLNLINYKPKK